METQNSNYDDPQFRIMDMDISIIELRNSVIIYSSTPFVDLTDSIMDSHNRFMEIYTWLLGLHNQLWRSVRCSLQWRHNERYSVSNDRRLDCLLNRLFRCTPKKTSKLASLAIVRGIHRWPVDSPHKSSVMRKCFHLLTSSCMGEQVNDLNGDFSLNIN